MTLSIFYLPFYPYTFLSIHHFVYTLLFIQFFFINTFIYLYSFFSIYLFVLTCDCFYLIHSLYLRFVYPLYDSLPAVSPCCSLLHLSASLFLFFIPPLRVSSPLVSFCSSIHLFSVSSHICKFLSVLFSTYSLFRFFVSPFIFPLVSHRPLYLFRLEFKSWWICFALFSHCLVFLFNLFIFFCTFSPPPPFSVSPLLLFPYSRFHFIHFSRFNPRTFSTTLTFPFPPVHPYDPSPFQCTSHPTLTFSPGSLR